MPGIIGLVPHLLQVLAHHFILLLRSAAVVDGGGGGGRRQALGPSVLWGLLRETAGQEARRQGPQAAHGGHGYIVAQQDGTAAQSGGSAGIALDMCSMCMRLRRAKPRSWQARAAGQRLCQLLLGRGKAAAKRGGGGHVGTPGCSALCAVGVTQESWCGEDSVATPGYYHCCRCWVTAGCGLQTASTTNNDTWPGAGLVTTRWPLRSVTRCTNFLV